MKKIIISILLSGLVSVSMGQHISGGFSHALFLCENGTPMSWGYNAGALGNGSTGSSYVPLEVTSLDNIVAVAAGGSVSFFVKNDGTVYATGENVSGAFGDSLISENGVTTPVLLNQLSDIKAVSSSTNYPHTLFLKNNGTVWACGQNGNGQLGNGVSGNYRGTPFQIPSLTNVTAVSAGLQHSLFLKNDGTVWGCGSNTDGTLGYPTSLYRSETPIQIPVINDIVSIAAGANNSLFVKSDGTVWGCGRNNWGELGIPETQVYPPVQIGGLSDITAVSMSIAKHSLFLKNDGTVWACGVNGYGQLGIGSTSFTEGIVQVNINNVVAISAGELFSLFLKNDGTVWACGYNGNGVIGDGTAINRYVPVPIIGLCSSASGIDEKAIAQIVIAPNPSTGKFVITSDITQGGTVEVYSITGAKIFSQTLSSLAKASIDISGQTNGVYVVKVSCAENMWTQRIIKE